MNRFGFYACYKNQVNFYKVQKSSWFLLKSYKNQIGFYGCYKNKVDFCSLQKPELIFASKLQKPNWFLASSYIGF